jgi:hypothetical protein
VPDDFARDHGRLPSRGGRAAGTVCPAGAHERGEGPHDPYASFFSFSKESSGGSLFRMTPSVILHSFTPSR